jgi:hypothetical protein
MWISWAACLLSAGLLVVDATTRADATDVPAIRVRIYDYAGIVPNTLSGAQRLAASYYAAIDVAIEWAPTFGPHGRKNGASKEDRLQDYSIMVMSRSMVARRPWPPGVIGSAVVAPEGGGRIAYVLYDRLKDAATSANWPVQELLGVVVAHELAHLLLPAGSHSPDGLMRKGWDVSELRQFDARSLAGAAWRGGRGSMIAANATPRYRPSRPRRESRSGWWW